MISLKDDNGIIRTDPKLVANMLNSHFTQKRLNLASKLPNSQSSIFDCMGPRLERVISANQLEDNEIMSCILDLNVNKESKLLKWLAVKLTPVLKMIFNRFFGINLNNNNIITK